MFGRRGKKKETARSARAREAERVIGPSAEDTSASAPPEPAKEADRYRALGPWDASEDAPEAQRMDLGALRVPVVPGTGIQVNSARGGRPIGVTLHTQRTALQLQPFSAPKSSGVWEEMREELRSQVTAQGGKVEDFDGTFGPELRAVIPVAGKKDDQGRQLGERVRYIGVDGPRWVLFGVIRGEGAVKPEAMAGVEELFQKIVVVRGETPMPPRELLPIVIPPGAVRNDQQDAGPGAPQAGTAPAVPGTGVQADGAGPAGSAGAGSDADGSENRPN
ncbi:DUF3710 domain-containing protein [Streptomonospora nanhaiensis]|uniref:DUF3710 domain-containing protein n=1 Tax=Streptomonospora nanhaiensis TaxID=1323731 RepID=A0A853BGV2_9ACTN|nr:DUF3710 domain-containing protein [Streptomonospora nanhaiensis]MBV2366604.1 DUF3710 domain-containing protein [Streptomonospora nanhaiensis]MBX9388607.1 DUF3710 domain-containing protein [Streptomonospora nanhaiensis]NYI93841.1 hypothetical protein [Streptomonospora nanhaiensis]